MSLHICDVHRQLSGQVKSALMVLLKSQSEAYENLMSVCSFTLHTLYNLEFPTA